MRGHGKGINTFLSFSIVIAITITAIATVLVSSKQTVEGAIASVDVRDAENLLTIIGNRIREVASEGNGSSRLISFIAPGEFSVMSSEDAVEYVASSTPFEYLSRFLKGNIIYISGNDVSCYIKDYDGDGDTDIVMENTYIRAVLQHVSKSSPYSAINTENNILFMSSKIKNMQITMLNSSIMIDGNSNTSYGTGYSELLTEGTSLPLCTAHFFIDSSEDYSIYYRLYAGADFVTAEIKLGK